MNPKGRPLGRTLLFGFIIFPLLVTQLYPLIWLLLYSLKSNEEIFSGKILALPKEFRFENYVLAVSSGHYIQYLINSIIVTGITLLLLIFLSTSAAYVISRFRFKYSKILLLIFLMGMMLPMQSALLPLMILLKNLGLLNTYLALILPYTAFSMPISIFILSNFMRSIPRELEESAIIDGAGPIRIFWSLILPISRPAITTISILAFISAWNEYIVAATFISSEKLKTLPFGAYSFVSQYAVNYGAIGAYLILAALPMVIIYSILSERITKGMVEGAVKG
ncbi:MAG: carbohydrate ABC transporter permease [Hydrogenibacillus sp.]|nr:carbohydrate ABC transporter permease [Hydrogenibacillus sp.]